MRLPMRLLQRKADSHKGDFGHIFIIAGSARFSGAAVLCAESAMRTGAGLVTLGIPKGINSAVIKIKAKEVMTLPLPETGAGGISLAALKKIEDFSSHASVIVIGPGLGQEKSTQNLARKIAMTFNKPMIIDADGLNALAGKLKGLGAACRPAGRQVRILTPHPGEMARLLGVDTKQVQANRKKVAKKFANDYNVTIVLKGHKTIVASPKGDLYVNSTGNPGMSTAGSGDVLTGMIAALLAQGVDVFSAAKYAVYLHGLAGDLAAEEKTQISLIASDIIAKIPQAIELSF